MLVVHVRAGGRIVTTIGGLLALLAIPVAQYPDIVPPQVSVTTFYPGASSGVVDATIAQPIEAQVVAAVGALAPPNDNV